MQSIVRKENDNRSNYNRAKTIFMQRHDSPGSFNLTFDNFNEVNASLIVSITPFAENMNDEEFDFVRKLFEQYIPLMKNTIKMENNVVSMEYPSVNNCIETIQKREKQEKLKILKTYLEVFGQNVIVPKKMFNGNGKFIGLEGKTNKNNIRKVYCEQFNVVFAPWNCGNQTCNKQTRFVCRSCKIDIDETLHGLILLQS